MNKIQLVGQAITSTNYTTPRLFGFNPGPVREAAENFLAAGVTEIEIPEGVLNPEGRGENGCDEATLKETIAGLPSETIVLGTYLGGGTLDTYVDLKKRALDHLIAHFPGMRYGMLHPLTVTDDIEKIVECYAKVAEHAATLRKGFQLCFHNHYDSNGETADQMRRYLKAIAAVNHPALRWGPDTGHCHGMGEEYLAVLDEYAHLIGDFFHIKARVPAFDRLHGKEQYRQERDIWSNKAEVGGGLYSGFVNAADPEVTTPFKEVFRIIREKARPTSGVVRGAMEIDIPRQHPRLEVLCGVLYFKNVHGIQGAQKLSNDEIVARVFKTA
jgi:sugar phosphate isomerase/epimerase